MVNCVRTYKAVKLEYCLQHTGTGSAAAHPPRHSVFAQQYSSATLISFHLTPAQKNSAGVKKKVVSFSFLFFKKKLCKLKMRLSLEVCSTLSDILTF